MARSALIVARSKRGSVTASFQTSRCSHLTQQNTHRGEITNAPTVVGVNRATGVISRGMGGGVELLRSGP